MDPWEERVYHSFQELRFQDFRQRRDPWSKLTQYHIIWSTLSSLRASDDQYLFEDLSRIEPQPQRLHYRKFLQQLHIPAVLRRSRQLWLTLFSSLSFLSTRSLHSTSTLIPSQLVMSLNQVASSSGSDKTLSSDQSVQWDAATNKSLLSRLRDYRRGGSFFWSRWSGRQKDTLNTLYRWSERLTTYSATRHPDTVRAAEGAPTTGRQSTPTATSHWH